MAVFTKLCCILIISSVVAFVVAVNTKFVRYHTGFNPILNSFEMQSSITSSRTECGSVCEIMGCISFKFEETQNCTLYSVHMTDDKGDILDQYFVRSGAKEHIHEDIVTVCSSGNDLSTRTNNALQKDVVMSSQYDSSSPGSLMVDGSRSDIWPCASTGFETKPHITVDLWYSYEITTMYIVNRNDYPEELHHLVIEIGDDMSNLQTAFNHTNAIGADCTVEFDTPRRGRYVKLEIEAGRILTVCELEIYSVVQ